MTTPTDNKLAEALRQMVNFYHRDYYMEAPCMALAREALREHETAKDDGVLRSHERMIADYPKLSEFFSKHGLGRKWPPPSCFGCGADWHSWEGCTRHLELMDVYLCAKCAAKCTNTQEALREHEAVKARAEEYAKHNPLGGPATMFETIARRLRAGEEYHEVMHDYGIVDTKVQAISQDREDAVQDALGLPRLKHPPVTANGLSGGISRWDVTLEWSSEDGYHLAETPTPDGYWVRHEDLEKIECERDHAYITAGNEFEQLLAERDDLRAKLEQAERELTQLSREKSR
jgi:hypothetical protein